MNKDIIVFDPIIIELITYLQRAKITQLLIESDNEKRVLNMLASQIIKDIHSELNKLNN